MRIKTAQIVGKEAIYKIGNQLEVEQLKTMYGDDVGKVEIGIEYIDPRRFSVKQRKLFFSLLNDIYKYTGQGVKELEEYFYQEYYSATFGGVVDLHNSSGTTLSEVNLLIEIVINFIFEWNIPVNEAANILPKNEAYFLYGCCKYRKCMECGLKADIHHVDALGMGSNRNKANHLKHHFMALCRRHHQEIERIGRKAFSDKYHLPVSGIKLDLPTLKKLNIRGGYMND